MKPRRRNVTLATKCHVRYWIGRWKKNESWWTNLLHIGKTKKYDWVTAVLTWLQKGGIVETIRINWRRRNMTLATKSCARCLIRRWRKNQSLWTDFVDFCKTKRYDWVTWVDLSHDVVAKKCIIEIKRIKWRRRNVTLSTKCHLTNGIYWRPPIVTL